MANNKPGMADNNKNGNGINGKSGSSLSNFDKKKDPDLGDILEGLVLDAGIILGIRPSSQYCQDSIPSKQFPPEKEEDADNRIFLEGYTNQILGK